MAEIGVRQGDRLQPKQIQRHEAAWVLIPSLVVVSTGPAEDMTPELTAALLTAGRNGTSVPLVTSANADDEGVLESPAGQGTGMFIDTTTGSPIVDPVSGLEVVVEIDDVGGGAYTLRGRVAGGAAADLPIGTYDVYVPYLFSFEQVPHLANVLLNTLIIGQDPLNPLAPTIDETERLDPTGVDTFPAVSNSIFVGSFVEIILNGVSYTNLGPSAHFTAVGTTITWSAADTGLNAMLGDRGVIKYRKA